MGDAVREIRQRTACSIERDNIIQRRLHEIPEWSLHIGHHRRTAALDAEIARVEWEIIENGQCPVVNLLNRFKDGHLRELILLLTCEIVVEAMTIIVQGGTALNRHPTAKLSKTCGIHGGRASIHGGSLQLR